MCVSAFMCALLAHSGMPMLPLSSRLTDMKCVRLEASEANTDVETEIYGLSELARKDQVALKAELAKVDPPTHIQAIDPNDPEFLKSKVRGSPWVNNIAAQIARR